MNQIPDLQAVTSVLHEAVAKEGLDRYREVIGRDKKKTKFDGSFVTELDQRLQESILSACMDRWPQYDVLGEEMDHSNQVRVCSSDSPGFWVLDPLDGTTNFIAGFPFFGVSLALIIRGEPKLAIVYDPVRGEYFSAKHGEGAKLNGQPLCPSPEREIDQCIANIDYKRLVKELAERLVSSPPYRSQRNLGACVLEWCWLAAGRIHLYLHGGQKLWDYAAGSLILKEAGGDAITLAGNSLEYSKLKKQSVVAANNQELLHNWYRWIAQNHPSGKRM